jgi:hypothetical protein
MTVRKTALPRTSGSKLAQVDAHELKPHEYKDLPELTDDMLKRSREESWAEEVKNILVS